MRAQMSLVLVLLASLSLPAMADDRLVRLAVPGALAESGLMQYMLPRFSLKTQVKVQVVRPGEEAEAALGARGAPVFSGEGRTWRLAVLAPDHVGAGRLADWMTSEVGQRAITGFQRDGRQVFSLPEPDEAATEEVVFEGDATHGAALARQHCGRCHVSVADEPMRGIGSTPSFFVLRALGDWAERFRTFYVRNPHPAFTQIEGVTDPFPATLPPPIHPLEITPDDLEAILAYVSALAPADLGAPLQVQ